MKPVTNPDRLRSAARPDEQLVSCHLLLHHWTVILNRSVIFSMWEPCGCNRGYRDSSSTQIELQSFNVFINSVLSQWWIWYTDDTQIFLLQIFGSYFKHHSERQCNHLMNIWNVLWFNWHRVSIWLGINIKKQMLYYPHRHFRVQCICCVTLAVTLFPGLTSPSCS